MRFKIFVLFVCIVVAYLSACGLYSTNNESAFSSNNSNRKGDSGEGDIPRLSERSKSRPDLDDEVCDDQAACRIVCRAMYDDADSEDECVELTYGKVEALEEVYLALRNGEPEDADPSLEDIDFDDLEEYLDIGWDGWIDVVIHNQREDGDYDKLFNTLKWTADEPAVADTLKNVRRDTGYDQSGILRSLFVSYCDPDSNGACSNTNIDSTILNSQDINGSNNDVSFEFNNGNLACSISGGSPTIIASITENRKKELFVALSAVEGSWNFFNSVAGSTQKEDALELAHELLEIACETSAGAGSTKFEQCVRGFYCWLNSSAHSFSNEPIQSSDFEEIETSLNSINLDRCTCGEFTGI